MTQQAKGKLKMRTGAYNDKLELLCPLIPTGLNGLRANAKASLLSYKYFKSLHLHATISCVLALLTLLLGAIVAVSIIAKSISVN
jgi:hypothetical protein